ncbi:MAG: TauD/TfdA dioxygenase family protein [Vulcanimicrobiaceae bacterium]
MSIDFQPISSLCGVEVRGLDPRQPVTNTTRDLVTNAFNEYHLVLIRGYELTEDQQVSFTQILGPLTNQGDTMSGRRSMFISNAHADGALPDGEIFFHNDHAFFEFPKKAIGLHALAAPSKGGETLFGNIARAYANLPDALKQRIADLKALHVKDYGVNRGDVQARDLPPNPSVPQAVHPVVKMHPITKEPLLFVSRLLTHSIVGIPERESEALLDELLPYTEDPATQYAHQWKVGDYIVWDNLYLQHARTVFDPSEKRVLRHVPISGGDVKEPALV